ncbi:hypothetical protein [Staphylococcus xylosus]|uniref:hypothetical protein n=1 Tax=Staphylococcus xylosus TaxID=1288 RepID=UPI002DBDCFB5|nr:hypothetical protein [Staphylococcus xylosus]MEB8101042.1 hypothetical protein [Staphylococcus xylosus]
MWMILAILFFLTTLISLLVIKTQNEAIKALEYAINIEVEKAMQEWMRHKG